jgi:polysaccharide export outer membrane protein
MKNLAAALLCLLVACSAPPSVKPNDNGGNLPTVPVGQMSPEDDAEAMKILDKYAQDLANGYPLYPGDHVRFSVLGNPDLSFSTRVPSEGFINYPLIGKVMLVGRTTDQVREDLQKRLGQDYLVNPDVTVLIDDYAKKFVYVLGSVKEPKQYELPNGQMITLLQSVALAGGFLESAEKHQVLIFRRRAPASNERLTLPVNTVNLTIGGKGKDPLIIPDDVVFVPSREGVYVLGQVNKPGSFTIQADHPVSVSQAIALAGGLTRLSADGSVRLIRKQSDGSRKTYIVNVSRVLAGHPEDDVVLQPGDTVFVPESIF